MRIHDTESYKIKIDKLLGHQMVKRVRECHVTKTLLGSTLSAYREYVRICDFTMGVYETPEYWYTASIARALAKTHKSKNIYPVLEDSMSSVSSYRTKGGKGRFPNTLRKGGRTDIALWRYKASQEDWEPISVIEVKRGWGWGGNEFKKDVERILAALDKLGKKNGSGSLENGFFVIVSDDWMTSKGEQKSRSEMIAKFEKDFKAIEEKIKAIVKKTKYESCNTITQETSEEPRRQTYENCY